MDDDTDSTIDPERIGSRDAPPIEEKPYKLIFEANRCIGTGRCAAVAANWEASLESGIATPRSYFLGEDELAANLAAAAACPAKKGRGVIHVVDRRTNDELAPDPHGDGTLSVEW